MMNGQGLSQRVVWLAIKFILLAWCAVYWITEAKAAPTIISETGVLGHLSQFRYLSPDNPKRNEIMSEKAIPNEISEPKTLMGIIDTSNTNVETARLITLPRCVIEDTVESRTGSRTKRYLLHRTKWLKKNLTYNISKYSTTLPKEDVDREIARAFALWSNYTNLKFSQNSKRVDIEIRFERGDHGDNKPFHATLGNQLAHSFVPSSMASGGDVHFDDDQPWSINSYLGINLFQVAVHEFGHSLGLKHSRIRNSVMAPKATNYNPNFTLHRDDIAGIQALYGPKAKKFPKALRIPRPTLAKKP